MEDLGFALIMLLVLVWLTSWSIFSAITAGFLHKSTFLGALLGVTLGPLGLLATLALPLASLDSAAETAPSPLIDSRFMSDVVVDPFA